VAVFTVIGWAVGMVLEGKLDVQSLLGRVSDQL